MDNINSISPSIRDFLLSKNLIFADSITKNYVDNYGNGLGRPVELGDGMQSVIDSQDLEDFGSSERQLQIVKNKFVPTLNSMDRIDIEYNDNLNKSQIDGGYYLNGQINGIDNTDLLNGLVNIFSGDSYFSYGTQLSSKLLQNITDKNDTQLGVIGYNELVNQFKFRVSQNLSNETIGRVNLNLLSLLSGDEFIKSDYRITKSSTLLGRFADKAMDILGVQNPMEELKPEASIFNSDLPDSVKNSVNFIDTNERNSQLLSNTGLGQQKVLFGSFLATLDSKYNNGGQRYAPNYKFNRINESLGGSEYVVYTDGERLGSFEEHSEGVLDKYHLDSTTLFSWEVDDERSVNKPEYSDQTDWEGKEFITNEAREKKQFFDKKTLLGKTQELFNNGKIKTLVGNKGMVIEPHELVTSTTSGSMQPMISKGSQVMYAERSTEGTSDNPNEVFCRAWVNTHRYDTVNKLQKHRGLDLNGGNRSEAIKFSVLEDNGFVKIAPYDTDPMDNPFTDPKKYMFSLENLAWCKDLNNLPNWEIGEGDPLTGTRGRIMWFPPYDLQFSENTGVNLDTHNFIGRGEPIYTYNSTERTGNLSFKVIIDHPEWIHNTTLLEEYEYVFDDLYNSLMAGCGNLPEYYSGMLTQNEIDEIETEIANEPVVKPVENETAPEPFKIYFPNDVVSIGDFDNMNITLDTFDFELNNYLSTVPTIEDVLIGNYAYFLYEVESWETPWKKIQNQKYTAGWHSDNNIPYDDRTNLGLNKSWKNQTYLTLLRDQLKECCPSCKVIINGYASKDGQINSNDKLSDNRATEVMKFFEKFILFDDTVDRNIRFGVRNSSVVGKGETGSNDPNLPVDHKAKKDARFVTVSFEPDVKVQQAVNEDYNKKMDEQKKKLINAKIKSRFYNESVHFKKLAQDDPFTYNKIKDRIKFFQPSFHSITPEGFNSRLTFLNQCTRQGSTISDSKTLTDQEKSRPQNMVFGAPPVCILRVGDFYNTKIMIDTMSIEYEGLWDLNPEGIGVQPMIANVSISFKFLGGSSMQGAINRLQNAISFNYYANTEIYDPRAHTISKNTDSLIGGAKYVQTVDKVQEVLYGKTLEERFDIVKPDPNENNQEEQTTTT